MEDLNDKQLPKEIKKVTLKEFIDQSVNLLTVFAIFNGLTIYSASLGNATFTLYLSVLFLSLSILTWFELISFGLSVRKEGLKFDIFIFLIVFVEIALVCYFIYIYAFLVYLISFFAIFWIYFIIVYYLFKKISTKIFSHIYRKLPSEKQKKKITGFTFVYFLILMIPCYFLSINTFRYTNPFVQPFIEQRLNALDSLLKNNSQ